MHFDCASLWLPHRHSLVHDVPHSVPWMMHASRTIPTISPHHLNEHSVLRSLCSASMLLVVCLRVLERSRLSLAFMLSAIATSLSSLSVGCTTSVHLRGGETSCARPTWQDYSLYTSDLVEPPCCRRTYASSLAGHPRIVLNFLQSPLEIREISEGSIARSGGSLFPP